MAEPKTVGDYIAAQPEAARDKLVAMRKIILGASPQIEEKLSYGMPYYSLIGRLLYFGAFKDHVSLFPMKSGIANFQAELVNYETSAGTIQFPLDKPLPTALIRKLVKFRAQENLAKIK